MTFHNSDKPFSNNSRSSFANASIPAEKTEKKYVLTYVERKYSTSYKELYLTEYYAPHFETGVYMAVRNICSFHAMNPRSIAEAVKVKNFYESLLDQ